VNWTALIANSLWSASNAPAYLRFRRALPQPDVAQRGRLRCYFAANANTAFGKEHRFSGIQSYEEFTRRVPFQDYEELRPWIERIRHGESNVLTRERVTHLVPTSGSTSARKLIPFTRGLQREFDAGLGPWLFDLFRQMPGLARGPAYWSVTPALQKPEVEDSAVPIGFEGDTAYLGGAKKRFVDAVMAVPAVVRDAPSLDAFRHATLLSLLRCRELRLISVWHPSFLSLLLEALPACWEQLLDDVASGRCGCTDAFPESVRHELNSRPMPKRAGELRRFGPFQPEALWPKLGLISCWGGGAAALALSDLRRRFPNTRFQAKGLLATEAFVTLPFGAHQPLAINSHFFEFIDEDGQVHLADHLHEGSEYEVVVTTAGGLWRYKLGDRVAVTGWMGQTPSLRFLGRGGNVSDRFGEKLSETFVTEVLSELFHERPPRFALLAPEEDAAGCRYTLYVEGVAPLPCVETLERALRGNPHYAWCRDLGQLLPPRLFAIAGGGYERFVERQAAVGPRIGDVKPAALSRASGWSGIFSGYYVAGSTDDGTMQLIRGETVTCRRA
jgi:hypothetical protein